MDVQKKIVKVITVINDHLETLENALEKTKTVRKSMLFKLFSTPDESWKVTTLEAVLETELFCDGDWVESKDQDHDGGNRLIQLADIGDGTFLDKSDRWMNDEQFNRLNCTPVEVGDILIARMPEPIARACLVPHGLPRSCVVVDIAICRAPTDAVLPEFLMLIINEQHFRSKAVSKMTGTTRKRLSRKNLASIEFHLPPLSEQRRISDDVGSINLQVETIEMQISHVKSLRQVLISELLTGARQIPNDFEVPV